MDKKVRAGELRFVIEVQEPVETRNRVGEVVKEFVYRGTFRGSINPMRGEERFSMDQAKAVVDTTIRTRGNAAPYLTPTMQLRHKDRVFDIDSIINLNSRNIVKEIYCKEIQ